MFVFTIFLRFTKYLLFIHGQYSFFSIATHTTGQLILVNGGYVHLERAMVSA
jgi:hypothetical protein